MRTRGALRVGLAFTLAGSLTACDAFAQPPTINDGIIVNISNTSEPDYGYAYSCDPTIDMEGNATLDCGMHYKYLGKKPTITIRIAGCALKGTEVEIAEPGYIHNHLSFPSDYPMTAEGQAPGIIDGEEQPVNCGLTVEFPKDFGSTLQTGDYIGHGTIGQYNIDQTISWP